MGEGSLKSPQPFLLSGSLLLLSLTFLIQCSLWQSEGREFLEKQGLEFSAQKLQNFAKYQNENCTTAAKFIPEDMFPSGNFSIKLETQFVQLKAYVTDLSSGLYQHWVFLEDDLSPTPLYCSPIELESPTRYLMPADIENYFLNLD